MDYKSLKKIILYHDKLYYDLGKPVLEDSEYDSLFDKLVEIEKHQGWKDPDSPTIRITAAAGKIKHPHKLYSLKKVYERTEVDAQFDLELPKLDGVNLSVTYNNKVLYTVLTRGDGEFGENVAHLSRVIKGIPATLTTETSVTFVGEVVTDNFEVENFRNYVAGALGLKSAKEAETRNLRFVVHDVLGSDINFLDRMKFARDLGFSTVDVGDYSKYPQDGIVFRTNLLALEQNLGYTAKYPRFAVALKQKEHFSGVTYLKDIAWTVGRSGVVTPVGILEPIILDSAVVSRVILHNIEFVEQNNLRRGDMILVERRITPQFVRVIESSNYAPFTVEDAKTQLGAEVYRKGPKLFVDSEDGLRLVEYFVKTLGIKGLGSASIKKLEVYHPIELFNRSDWEILGKNGLKIQEELNRPKDYATVLAALGIPGVGKTTAQTIVENIPKFDDLRDIGSKPIKGIGPATIDSILSWLDVNEDWVKKLPYPLEATVSGPVTTVDARKVAISGKLDMTKSEMADHLARFNFVVIDSVTKDCYALISSGDESTKVKQAQKYGVPIYNYWNNRAIILKGMF
jgi:DNA ligase (NAD+)